MVDYDKLYYTPIYNWSIISHNHYQIYCKSYDGWRIFTYNKNRNILTLLQSVEIYCDSFEKANEVVYNVLILKKWQIHPRYLGRKFKIKKLMNQKVEHNIMNI